MTRVAAVLVLLLAGCAGPQGTSPPEATPSSGGPHLQLEMVADGFVLPDLYLAHEGRAYVVEQGGRVWQVEPRRLVVDASNLTAAGGERGLLGAAFYPRGADKMVISYTDLQGDTALQNATLREDGPALLGDVFFHLHQPYPNHNGGHVVFGPDGWLWFGLGDGGGGGDPQGNGQNPDALLASIVRFDLANGSVDPHIWAKGLRNPWRFSFDPANGDLWIADVGQDRYEEIDHVPAGATPPLDFGWNAREGKHPYAGGSAPFMALTEPVGEYDHGDGSCSVTGGVVYRGRAIPSLVGSFLFADYCSGHLWSIRPDAHAYVMTRLMETGLHVSSFGADAASEAVLCDHEGGSVLRLVAG